MQVLKILHWLHSSHRLALSNLSDYFPPLGSLYSLFTFSCSVSHSFPFSHTYTQQWRHCIHCTKREDIGVVLFTLDFCQVKRHPSLVCKTPWLDGGLWQVATVFFHRLVQNGYEWQYAFWITRVWIVFFIQLSHIYIIFLYCLYVFLRKHFTIDRLLFETICLC